MVSSLPSYCFGPFSVLMVVTALNDYQLKGTADKAYWPKIRKVLEASPSLSSPNKLCSLLTPFYQNERLNKNKIERLKRFLGSPLSSELWKSNPHKVSEEFLNIWHELARTMNQNPSAKTLVFSMK